MMLYVLKRAIMLKVVGAIVYIIQDNWFLLTTCVYTKKNYQKNACFKDTIFDRLIEFWIPDVLINTMSFHGLSKRQLSKVFLSYHQNMFRIIFQKNCYYKISWYQKSICQEIPIKVNKKINKIDNHNIFTILAYHETIYFQVNTLKKLLIPLMYLIIITQLNFIPME